MRRVLRLAGIGISVMIIAVTAIDRGPALRAAQGGGGRGSRRSGLISMIAGTVALLLLAGGMVLACRRCERRQPAGPRTAARE